MSKTLTMMSFLAVLDVAYYIYLHKKQPKDELLPLSMWTNVFLAGVIIAFQPSTATFVDQTLHIDASWLVSVSAALAAFYCYRFFVMMQDATESPMVTYHLIALLGAALIIPWNIHATIYGQTAAFSISYMLYRLLWLSFLAHTAIRLMLLWSDQQVAHHQEMDLGASTVLFLFGGACSLTYFSLMAIISVVPIASQWSHDLIAWETGTFFLTYGSYLAGAFLPAILAVADSIPQIQQLRIISYYLLIAPLWKRMIQQHPEIHLELVFTFRQALFSKSEMRLLLYRTVIEVLDCYHVQLQLIANAPTYEAMVRTVLITSLKSQIQRI